MLVYVAMGPEDREACRFFSRTIVDRFFVACVILDCVDAPFDGSGVAASVAMAEL